MKRKRGHKKGKFKKAHNTAKTEGTPNVSSLNNIEDNYNNEDNYGNDEYESPMEVDTPSSTGTDHQLNVPSVYREGSNDKAVGKPVGRVKVKLKASKMLDSSHSDTDKSSSQMGMERQSGVGDKIEDGGISLTEMRMGILGTSSKKAGSIKIKSSRALSGSTVSKTPPANRQFNKEELDSALSVIRKIMKMEAAVPFNVPVNPEALGIPDYFDIIDTPMDFGTICSNIENGEKYKNSEDVFKDVQYIWANCSKYNNKGDFVLELMKRVKKNFMKYWVAAGLYTDQSSVESIQGEDAAQSSQGKTQVKSSQSKPKSGKRHGRRHKHDCLCAICVLKRRKREREEQARIAKGHIGVSDAQESKQEESSLVESPGGDDSSSDMGESRDLGGDDEVEGRKTEMSMENAEKQYSGMDDKREEEEEGEEDEEEEEEDEDEEEDGGEEEAEEEKERDIENQKKDSSEIQAQSQSEERNRQPEPGTAEKSGAAVQSYTQGREEETAAIQQQKVKDAQNEEERAKMYKKFRVENPMLLNLCGILFPKDQKSVWGGPHSLVRHQGSAARTNSICAAVDSLMQ